MIFKHHKQHGFTIITVLIIAMMGSIIVMQSLKDSILQERMSGNFQKKMNARLLSEKGVFDVHDTINQLLNANPSMTIADLIAASNNGVMTGTGILAGSEYAVAISELSGGAGIELASIGEQYEGENTLRATFELIQGSGVSPFSDAVIGCEGVTLNGSGTVDSYDSSVGTYNAATAEKEGDVSTIEPNSDVTLNGHSPIYGDIQSTGEVSLGGSSPVYGNIYATGDVSINQSIVEGYVWTAGNYKMANGGTIFEYVRANGDAEMGWSALILNQNNFGLDILYGGGDRFKDTSNNSQYGDAQYNVNPNIAPVPEYDPSDTNYDPTDPATNCDPINIANEVTSIDDGVTGLQPLSVGANQVYELTPTSGRYTANGSGVISPVSATLFGKPVSVYKMESYTLNSNSAMNITGGDVVMYVDGDFSLSGSGVFTIEADSSLTLVVTGKFSVGGSARIIASQHGLTDTGKPALSIFSSNSDNNGVAISGSSDIYAAIYAPLTDVKVVGSGTVYGAVRAKTATVSGGGGFHFDKALRDSTNGAIGNTNSRLVLKALKYY
ncbi:MAG: DUF7305 domain-containing protein [Thalassotalea sp.]